MLIKLEMVGILWTFFSLSSPLYDLLAGDNLHYVALVKGLGNMIYAGKTFFIFANEFPFPVEQWSTVWPSLNLSEQKGLAKP